MIRRFCGVLFCLGLWLNVPLVHASAPVTLVVEVNGRYPTPQAALAVAHDGDTIQVQAGVYAGPLVVDKRVQLEGVGWPVLDGGEQDTVVTFTAAGSSFSGFIVRGSGSRPDHNDSGLHLQADHITIRQNQLEDVLFGIFVEQANNALLQENAITSKAENELGSKGDAIRLWYSRDVTIRGNTVDTARDIVLWYSENVVLQGNVVQNGRYGVHLMYCNNATIQGNRLYNNSVGIYTMYSNGVTIQENLIQRQRGPSGYALGFKDADNLTVQSNVLVDNGAAVFLDGTPFTPSGYSHFTDNIFAFNDVGLILQPNIQANVFHGNTFWENGEQVAVQGGGVLGANDWQGNYWSDYAGFDGDGDGVGDVAYQAERFFEGLTDREPRLQALIYTPAAQAIEFTAQTFPIIRPQPKLSDTAPQMNPLPIPAFAVLPASTATTTKPSTAVALFAACLLLFTLSFALVKNPMTPKPMPSFPAQTPLLELAHVTKQYGKTTALRDVTFTVTAGQAVALWGANGAGKTTLIKAILGLITVNGRITLHGYDAARQGKQARAFIGYVPQEANFHDWSVQATMEFYARLKANGRHHLLPAIPRLLAQLGLAEHTHKPVTALSGGLKQRLALAIALLADPPLLLLDEPTANLDARARHDYLALLTDLRRAGKTLVFASHRLEELEVLADSVVILEQGVLLERITPQVLRQRQLPDIALTLWIDEGQRATAVTTLQTHGLNAHLNGHGTVVVSLPADQKMRPLHTLSDNGITVHNFEMEQTSWN